MLWVGPILYKLGICDPSLLPKPEKVYNSNTTIILYMWVTLFKEYMPRAIIC